MPSMNRSGPRDSFSRYISCTDAAIRHIIERDLVSREPHRWSALTCHGSATNLLKRPTTEGLFCHLETLEFCWRVKLSVWRGYAAISFRDSDQIVGEQAKHELGDPRGRRRDVWFFAWCRAACPSRNKFGHRPRSREYRDTRRMLMQLRDLYAMLIVRDAWKCPLRSASIRHKLIKSDISNWRKIRNSIGGAVIIEISNSFYYLARLIQNKLLHISRRNLDISIAYKANHK